MFKRALPWFLSLLLMLTCFSAVSAETAQGVVQPPESYQFALRIVPNVEVLLTQKNAHPERNPIPYGIWPNEDWLMRPDGGKVLADAVANLTLSGYMTPDHLKATLGTKDGDLAEVYAWADARSGGNGFVTDLAEVVYHAPQQAVKSALDFSRQLLASNVDAALGALYADAVKMLEEKAADAVAVTGEFSVDMFGTFTAKRSIVLNHGDMHDVFSMMLDKLERDRNAAALLNMGARLGSSPGDQQDVFLPLRGSIAGWLEQKDEPAATLTIHTAGADQAPCYVLDLVSDHETIAWQAQDGLRFLYTMYEWVAGAGYGTGGRSAGARAENQLWGRIGTMDGNFAAEVKLFGFGEENLRIHAEAKVENLLPLHGELTIGASAYGGEDFATAYLTISQEEVLAAMPDTTGWPSYLLGETPFSLGGDTTQQMLLMRRLSMAFPDTAEDIIKALSAP